MVLTAMPIYRHLAQGKVAPAINHLGTLNFERKRASAKAIAVSLYPLADAVGIVDRKLGEDIIYAATSLDPGVDKVVEDEFPENIAQIQRAMRSLTELPQKRMRVTAVLRHLHLPGYEDIVRCSHGDMDLLLRINEVMSLFPPTEKVEHPVEIVERIRRNLAEATVEDARTIGSALAWVIEFSVLDQFHGDDDRLSGHIMGSTLFLLSSMDGEVGEAARGILTNFNRESGAWLGTYEKFATDFTTGPFGCPLDEFNPPGRNSELGPRLITSEEPPEEDS